MTLFDDEDYPLVAWAADRDVVPDRNCPFCWGEGADGDLPCRCLADACFNAFRAAADDAEPVAGCRWCDGDGENYDGDRCLCLLVDLRRQQEELEPDLDD